MVDLLLVQRPRGKKERVVTNLNSSSSRATVSDSAAASEIIRDLIAVLHPGAVGLIHHYHGEDRCAKACEAITAAKAFLARAGALQNHRGTLDIDGVAVSAEFAAPVGATRMERDAAFLAALAQQCEIEIETIPVGRELGEFAAGER